MIAALLGANLENAAGLLGDLGKELPLVDGQGQGFLAINVLAARMASTTTLVCQWSGVPQRIASMSLRSRTLR